MGRRPILVAVRPRLDNQIRLRQDLRVWTHPAGDPQNPSQVGRRADLSRREEWSALSPNLGIHFHLTSRLALNPSISGQFKEYFRGRRDCQVDQGGRWRSRAFLRMSAGSHSHRARNRRARVSMSPYCAAMRGRPSRSGPRTASWCTHFQQRWPALHLGAAFRRGSGVEGRALPGLSLPRCAALAGQHAVASQRSICGQRSDGDRHRSTGRESVDDVAGGIEIRNAACYAVLHGRRNDNSPNRA
jgi:hypothetical protein